MRTISLSLVLLTALTLVSCQETQKSEPTETLKLQTVDQELGFYQMNFPYTSVQLDTTRIAFFKGLPQTLCSGLVSSDGNLHGRNLDWCYDQAAHVLITNYGSEATYRNIGMITGLGDYDNLKQITPQLIFLNDGINECGLVMQCNVVPGHDIKRPAYVLPCGEGTDTLPAFLVVRHVLDNCATVDEALRFVNNRKIVTDKRLADMNYDLHWLISDSTGACGVLEMADGQFHFLSDEHIVTNFYLTQFPDTSYISPYIEQSLSNGTTYRTTTSAAGIERQEILSRTNPTTVDEMKQAMQQVWFSHTYDPTRYAFYRQGQDYHTAPSEQIFFRSEFAGLTIEAIEYQVNTFEKGNRNKLPDDWYTSYTAIYDRPNLTIHVSPSESGKYYQFTLQK